MADMSMLKEKYGGILAIVFVIAVLVIAVAPSGFLTFGTDKAPRVSAFHSPSAPVEGQTVKIAVTASDDKLVTKMGVQLDGPKSAAMPYGRIIRSCTLNKLKGSCSFSFSGLIAGSYSYLGFAYDNAGAYAQSAKRNLTISPAPSNNTTNQTTYTLTLTKAGGTGTGTVTSSPAGINCGAACSGQSANFVSGTSVTLTASPSAGSVFNLWQGACTGTNPTCVVLMDASKSVFAHFGAQNNTTAGNGTQIIDLSLLNPNFKGYNAVAFDGRFVYFIPLVNANGVHGNIVRYDTAQNLPNATNPLMQPPWQAMDTKNSLSPYSALYSYSSASFDGRYVYFAPAYSGKILRYDTTGNFTNNRTTASGNPSWEAFDAQQAFGSNYGFFNYTNVSSGSVNFYTSYSYYIAKYNGGAFGNSNSWSKLNQTTPQNLDRNFTVTDNYGYKWYIVQKGVSTSGKVARYK